MRELVEKMNQAYASHSRINLLYDILSLRALFYNLTVLCTNLFIERMRWIGDEEIRRFSNEDIKS